MGGVLSALFGGHGHRRDPAGGVHRRAGRQPSRYATSSGRGRDKLTKKYSYIPDYYTTLEQVTAALREEGLESSNLILGIDFTKSNEWTGKDSFSGQSLHKLGDTRNPYEMAISIIGKTLAPFDEDNLIPCFGFGDATTHDHNVFSFHPDNSPCHGFEEVLACYRKIVPHLRLSGPTSFAPIVEAAVDIVDRSGGQYHVLVIVADGQVTRSVDTSDDDLSPQERRTVDSIVMASAYPLSIVLVGVGDGPWEDMKNFDDKIPARDFDNFQFVNFTSIMSRNTTPQQKESAFALAALMEVPIQYKATMELGILGRSTGKTKRIVPAPPPLPSAQRQQSLRREASNANAAAQPAAAREDQVQQTVQDFIRISRVVINIYCLVEQTETDSRSNGCMSMQVCPICLTNAKDLAFGCGHMITNLSFAAVQTHKWYHQKFEDYPRSRYAIIPSVQTLVCFGQNAQGWHGTEIHVNVIV